jgi:hypothetical protein
MPINMKARKYHLERQLGMRESNRLEELVGGHPSFDSLVFNPSFTGFTIQLKDDRAWVEGGKNMQALVKDFLDQHEIPFYPSVCADREAA